MNSLALTATKHRVARRRVLQRIFGKRRGRHCKDWRPPFWAMTLHKSKFGWHQAARNGGGNRPDRTFLGPNGVSRPPSHHGANRAFQASRHQSGQRREKLFCKRKRDKPYCWPTVAQWRIVKIITNEGIPGISLGRHQSRHRKTRWMLWFTYITYSRTITLRGSQLDTGASQQL